MGLTSSPRKIPLSPNPNKYEEKRKKKKKKKKKEEEEEEEENALCEGMNTHFLFSTLAVNYYNFHAN